MQSTTDKYYVPFVAPALIQHSKLSGSAKLVAVDLLMHRNRESGLCWPTEETISAELGISPRTVMRAIAELRKAGLIEIEARTAPRGRAKGRGNNYDLTALLGLCKLKILPAAEIISEREVTKTTPHSGSPEVTKTTPREVTKTTPHSSDFRAITDNSLLTVYSDHAEDPGLPTEDKLGTAAVLPNGEPTEPKEAGEVTKTTPHSARIAQEGPLKGLSSKRIQQQRIAPDGTLASNVGTEADVWDIAPIVVELAGGEELNPGTISSLCDTYGADRVWWHAKWFLSRIAALDSPPEKPAAYFIKSVREDYQVKPTWKIVTELHAELAQVEGRLAADNYSQPHHWFADYDRADQLRMKIADPNYEPAAPSENLLEEVFGAVA